MDARADLFFSWQDMPGRDVRSRSIIVAGLAALVLALLLPAGAYAGPIRAGAATVDAAWHVGASAGQYASTRYENFPEPELEDPHLDPSIQSFKNEPSYGIQSRLKTRAIVVEGPDGKRFAVVKNDLYIPQDLLWRRTAQILEEGNSGIGKENLTIAVSHDHSSPYYSSTAWGAWTFQDVFDVRFYSYYAERMARAVERAASRLRPVRVGATASAFDKTPRNALGPAVADDGTPAGFPDSYTDDTLTVVRFDDATSGAPVATLVNFSLHPEFLNGNDLISADYVGPLERMVDERTRAVMIFTQNAVGNSEPERSSYHSVHERLEFTHREYAQAEYGARLMSDAIVRNWRDIGRGRPNPDPAFRDKFVPFRQGEVPVAFEDRWFPGPISHPYPAVSNCRVDSGLAGEPQVPVAGLPNCQGGVQTFNSVLDEVGLGEPIPAPTSAVDPGLSTDDFEAAGIPIPENYGAPSYTGLQEDVSLHLQAFRIGNILFTVCPCEQWADQSRNIKTRTDTVPNNEWLGYDWSKQCTQNLDTTWTCADPTKQCLDNGDGTRTCRSATDPDGNLPPVSDQEYKRMKAQVNNPANGWNDPEYAPYAESEPVDTTKIKGNYTHDDTAENAKWGYRLTVPISMANDYNGYIATYREYQRGDHYRKALTGWGPHSSDYLATRLVGLGRELKGGPPVPAEPLEEKAIADQAVNDGKATAFGETGGNASRAYEDLLGDDAGKDEPREEPQKTERFGAAFFTWSGGNNYVDNPEVSVDRMTPTGWDRFAAGAGEVPVTLEFPPGIAGTASYLEGGRTWRWSASFEAFVSQFDVWGADGARRRATPAGTYRFMVRGKRRENGETVDYRLHSKTFEIKPWSGITAEDVRVEQDRTVSFRVGPRRSLEVTAGGDDITAKIGPIDYPDSYDSPRVRFINEQRTAIRDPDDRNNPDRIEWYCFTCSFRPWADTGDAASAKVAFVGPSGQVDRVAAQPRDGRWYTTTPLPPGAAAYVQSGCVRDAYGNYNGQPSGAAAGGAALPAGVEGTCRG